MKEGGYRKVEGSEEETKRVKRVALFAASSPPSS
jgi:hypothetical protein